MTTSKKELLAFVKQCTEAEDKAGTEISRQGSIAAKLSLRKGWNEDDMQKGKGEAYNFFVAALEARSIKPTDKSVERYSLAAHPNAREDFDKIMSKALPIQKNNPGSKTNNIQEAMLRVAKTGVGITKIEAAGKVYAKNEASKANAKKGGGSAPKTPAKLVEALNASIKRKLLMCYEKDVAESLYTELAIRKADLGRHKFKKKK